MDTSDRGRAAGARPGRVEWALLLLALALRVAWTAVARTDLWFDHVFTDATAMGLLEGRGFTVSLTPPYEPGIFRTPGYPAILAAVYGLCGHSVRAALFANALLDTASCALLWRLATRRVGPAAARWVLLLAATYPFSIHAAGTLSPESLTILLGLVLLATIEGWPASGGAGRVVATGLVLGTLAWVKPVFLPLPACLLLAERLRGRAWRTAFARAAAVGLIGALAIAPWVARNVREFGRPLLASELGIVLWHGTIDFDDARDEMIRSSFADAAAAEGDPYENARALFADSAEEIRRDDAHRAEALARMRERPLRALLDPLRRIPRLWVSTTYALGPWWIGAGAAAAGVAYLLLGFVGWRRVRGRRGELAAWWVLPVLLTGVHAVLHVEARYTLPARPSLLLLAGLGCAALSARLTRRGESDAGQPPPAG